MPRPKSFRTYYAKDLHLRIPVGTGGRTAQFIVGRWRGSDPKVWEAIEKAEGYGEGFWWGGF